jgi:hypothetical protein
VLKRRLQMDLASFSGQLERAAHRGADFLVEELAAGRVCVDNEAMIPTCYKVPFALAATGRWGAGNQVLDHIVQCSTKSGYGPGVFLDAPEGYDFGSHMHCYTTSVILYGAAALGRWDVASPAATQGMLKKQHAVGGFGYESVLGVTPTSMTGMYLLHRGRIAEAQAAADFLVKKCFGTLRIQHMCVFSLTIALDRYSA